MSLTRWHYLDFTRRTNNVATTVARSHASGHLPVGIRERRCLRSPVPTTINYLCAWITDEVTKVDGDVIRRMLDEIAY
jgi:hypothetical protein